MDNYITKTTLSNATTYVLHDKKISEALPIRDAGMPSLTTKGSAGQIYIDETSAQRGEQCVYICAGMGEFGYVWKPLKHSAPPLLRPKFLKWHITKLRAGVSTGSIIQMAEFQLLTNSESALTWNTENITTNISGFAGEEITKLIDNNTSNKYCASVGTTTQTCDCEIIISSTAGFDLTQYTKYRYYTANDSSERDPISWTLEGSNDGVNYTKLSEVADATIATGRNVVAGTWSINL